MAIGLALFFLFCTTIDRKQRYIRAREARRERSEDAVLDEAVEELRRHETAAEKVTIVRAAIAVQLAPMDVYVADVPRDELG